MNKNSWLIIADCSLARIFKVENNHSMNEIHVLEHPESRMHNLDLVTDKPGRDFASMGAVRQVGNTRHGVGNMNTPKKHEFEVFAREIANFLDQALHKNEFEYLYIAAAPKFLGLLRNALNPGVQKKICDEINSDLTHLKVEEILHYLHLHHTP